MARPGYLSLYADERTQKIFDEFVKIKEINKTTALSEMITAYMVATDEDLYLSLYKKSMNVKRFKDVIIEIEDTTPINDYILIKLGTAIDLDGNEMDGVQTMNAYMNAISLHSYTWFSTFSLHSGMAKDKVKFYNEAIQKGETVKVLFAVGLGINEVKYSATIKKIVSSRDEITCPGNAHTIPKEFGVDEVGKIWLKLENLKEETSISADQLYFRTNDTSARDRMDRSQFHFGYVYIK